MALDDTEDTRVAARADRAPVRPASGDQTRPGRRGERPDEGDSGESQGEADSEGDADHRPAAHTGHPARRRRILLVGGIVLLAVLVIGGTLYWLHARNFESTDDAYVDTHLIHVSPQIGGSVTRVYVNDNQLVRAGEVLAEIDAAQPRARLEAALADEAQARTQLQQAQAQRTAAQAAYDQATANAMAADAQAVNAGRDYQRYRTLKSTNPRAVAQIQLDQSEAAARSTTAQLAAARQQVRSAAAQIDVAQTQIAAAMARIRAAEAQAQEARISVGYTQVLAPAAGHVAQLSVAVGNYVAPGGQMMAIVPLAVWVTANFKETQLDLIRPGQSVDVHVDACPRSDLSGRVDSIERGAGQAFALLPPENATGNWVKVVQRVPVKIVLGAVPRDCPLGPGMSVEPKVRVR